MSKSIILHEGWLYPLLSCFLQGLKKKTLLGTWTEFVLGFVAYLMFKTRK